VQAPSSLFFYDLATAQLNDIPVLPMVAALSLSTLLIAVIRVALIPYLPVDNAAFTSVFQGDTFR